MEVVRHPARLRGPALVQRCGPARASAEVRGITHLGGTILGTTNRGNPFRYVTRNEQGEEIERDRSDDLVAAFQASGFDALVSIGGDGSLQISHDLWRKGLPVVCVPKTIDNDVSGTQRTFGFDTAVSTATEAIDKLHSTAESHDRVIVVELMGRYAGWIALYSGLSGSADVILMPEIPFDIAEGVREDPEPRGGRAPLQHRGRGGGCPAEGWHHRAARAPGRRHRRPARRDRQQGGPSHRARHRQGDANARARASAAWRLARPRTTGCSALRFGAAAVRAIADRAFGTMVGLNGQDITRVPLENVVGRAKNVPLDSDTIRTARDLGISLGD